MGTIQLAEHLYSVGVLNPGLRIFDIIMPAPYGTSCNAYLLTGEKNVLIETVHADYWDEYRSNIEQVLPLEDRLSGHEPQRARPLGQRGQAAGGPAPT